MGSSSSKDAVASTSDGVPAARIRGARVFQSFCLGRSSDSSDNDDQGSVAQNLVKGRLKKETFADQRGAESDHVKHECCSMIGAAQSNGELDGWSQERITRIDSGGESSSTQMVSSQLPNPLRRSRSRFSFIPNSINFRLSRAASLGSSASCSLFPTSLSLSNSEELPVHTGDDLENRNRNEAHPRDSRIVFPCSNLSNETQYQYSSSGISCVGPPLSGFSVRVHNEEPTVSSLSMHLHSENTVPSQDVTRTNSSMRIDAPVNQRNHTDIESIETRRFDRRTGVQEPIEGGVRFSRTMSVGRLRDRVLRRTPSSDLFGHLHDDRIVGETRQVNSRQFLHGVTRTETSDGNTDMQPPSSSQHLSSMITSMNSIQDDEMESPQLREASTHALVEHRTAFLERRRRIRSQFRALQRLGSRFENLSGHDRSCILSGQHRTGRCMCRANSRTAGQEEDTSTRASISRIVMLAEALFEVLDEIHQQSVVLSSRPSVSSIGSIPAPKEIVDCMPVKIYTKPPKHQNEEPAQCYICLVEYDDGDYMRILPCHHDFHQTCIDKWLKEIHRVCPLCRGDVCRHDLQPTDKVD
ncbi:E3 ubiquitin-protein ligase RLIM isoform X2 [Cinnamomum micranthum f. kanehirae]|uniref:E3 ubiquitin-protein ligase RLIM isoform X2 n=1 Tax=Cinnamomum micranthum f. kanehirae TaxID=337451 RepID=A0A443PFY5_9MAGN|nr:E3 ubiquitin-protein ligase RLIM isoform X2 [Cinnamomum micranthum f. kanehirae]